VLTRRLSGIRFGLPKDTIESYNRVLLVGIGGAGKTTLISRLVSNKFANPRVRTQELFTYSLVHEIIYQDNTSDYAISHVCRIDIDDYQGQSLNQITTSWKNDFRPDGAFLCTSVIFVVDLIEPPERPDAIVNVQDKFSPARVRNNIREWPRGLVQNIIDMTEPGNLKYICLFVNKIDLISDNSRENIVRIKAAYDSLWRLLYQTDTGAEYDLIVGSAATGDGVSQLLSRLIELSAPPGPGAH
jgi:GTPase SAR1 family protein